MTIKEVANKYHELASQNKWQEIVDTLYDDNIVSIEPANSKSPFPLTEGLEKVKQKNRHFQSRIEALHSAYSTQPIIAGNLFSIGMGMDIDMKDIGRNKFDEFCVFTVEKGKIVKEEFVMQWNNKNG